MAIAIFNSHFIFYKNILWQKMLKNCMVCKHGNVIICNHNFPSNECSAQCLENSEICCKVAATL